MIRRLFGILVLIALLLTGCVTGPGLTSKEVVDIAGGVVGMFVPFGHLGAAFAVTGGTELTKAAADSATGNMVIIPMPTGEIPKKQEN